MARTTSSDGSRWTLRPVYQHVHSPVSVCAEAQRVPEGAPRRVRANLYGFAKIVVLDPRQYTICLPAVRPTSSLIGAFRPAPHRGWRIVKPERSLINAQTSVSRRAVSAVAGHGRSELSYAAWPASIARGSGYVPSLSGLVRFSAGL